MNRSENVKIFRIAVFFLIFAVIVLLTAEQSEARKFEIGADFSIGSPQGEFGDTVDRNGYGFAVKGLYKPGILPFYIGLQLGYLQYGSTARTEQFSPEIPEVDVRVQTTNNIFTSHLLVRFIREFGRIMPYCEGLLGVNYFFTHSSVENEQFGNYPVFTTNNQDDSALSYGIGAGTMLKLYTFKPDSFKRRNSEEHVKDGVQLLLNLNIQYLKGGKADYLREGSIIHNGQDVTYDVKTSTTDLLSYQMGIVFSF